MAGLKDAIALRRAGNHSLVVASGGRLHTFDGRGVKDLLDLLTSGSELLRGAAVADKVIGKGAAALMAEGGVSEIYADIISTPALQLLKQTGIDVSFGKCVPNIINRTSTGICPVEALCAPCTTPAQCLPLIIDFVNHISNAK